MKYDFDQPVNRLNTASLKWDGAYVFLGEQAKGALPMWVADMDFRSPQEVIDELKKRVEHGIFGYPMCTQSYYDAVIGWMKRRFNWTIKQENIHYAPGIIPALNYLVQVFTEEGDCIAIQSPVYYPFTNSIVNNNRRVVLNCLKFEDGRYTMDYEDLEQKLSTNKVKLLILCSPHNPVGRVWSKEELTKLGEICFKHGVLVVSDEIHADLTLKGVRNTAFASISEEFAQNAIVCTAASKTFNLAGLQTANIIIPNKELGLKYNNYMKKLHLLKPNIFGQMATEVAYNYGAEWLEQLKDYLQGNLEYLTSYIDSNINKIKVIKPEGTYLVWLDCRELNMKGEELKAFMLQNAKVALDDGYLFGPGGEYFTRMNIGCNRKTLKEALMRIEWAVNHYRR
ncbi:MalY/PatB family protein [Sporomusa acidovorans]|uniref:cysteine-S-conjugate beta-lyase n=1 Tax=Sporomusa acidovorans (strain ATCC 49682 / DSM 3132 / Mol) TaxID=1123286 RepID=A0ABZ3J735_SPOA4|nr:MalY/PatB family protein [Sporomusa acidovorans]OZC18500.1 cystathionine beta-lyase PatB [Sporomusa acidovorans DSM 3132]SDE36719.1 cystathione beta-lyase [Sporomusa acidovorans]